MEEIWNNKKKQKAAGSFILKKNCQTYLNPNEFVLKGLIITNVK